MVIVVTAVEYSLVTTELGLAVTDAFRPHRKGDVATSFKLRETATTAPFREGLVVPMTVTTTHTS